MFQLRNICTKLNACVSILRHMRRIKTFIFHPSLWCQSNLTVLFCIWLYYIYLNQKRHISRLPVLQYSIIGHHQPIFRGLEASSQFQPVMTVTCVTLYLSRGKMEIGLSWFKYYSCASRWKPKKIIRSLIGGGHQSSPAGH